MLTTTQKFIEVKTLADQIAPAAEKVTFRNIFETSNGGVSLIAFKEGQALATHLAPAEVMVYVVDGEIEFVVEDEPRYMHTGEYLLIGKDVSHSVKAHTDAKVMLVKVQP